MAHVVTANCNECKYTDCCVVCPVECFYQDDNMLYIDPEDCIDCEACVPECPVEAIYAEANVPDQWSSYIELNKEKCANRSRTTAPSPTSMTRWKAQAVTSSFKLKSFKFQVEEQKHGHFVTVNAYNTVTT